MSWHIEHISDSFGSLAIAETNAADVIITDPPYPEHVQNNICSGSLVGTKNVPKYELSFAALGDDRALILARDCVRVASRWSVIFCALETFGLLKLATPEYVRGCVWYKPNSMGQLTADRPACAFEGVALLHGNKVKKRWNGKGSYGIWRCNGTRGKTDRHPNEKPIDLCLKLVALFSERGETVLDPFCGSGAIGEACVRLGRDYIGLDDDIKWVMRARERLSGPLAPVTDEEALALCTMPKVSEAA